MIWEGSTITGLALHWPCVTDKQFYIGLEVLAVEMSGPTHLQSHTRPTLLSLRDPPSNQSRGSPVVLTRIVSATAENVTCIGNWTFDCTVSLFDVFNANQCGTRQYTVVLEAVAAERPIASCRQPAPLSMFPSIAMYRRDRRQTSLPRTEPSRDAETQSRSERYDRSDWTMKHTLAGSSNCFGTSMVRRRPSVDPINCLPACLSAI